MGILAGGDDRKRRLPEPIGALIFACGVEVGAVNIFALRALVVVVDRSGAVHRREPLANAVNFAVHPVEIGRVEVNVRDACLALRNLVLHPCPAAIANTCQRRFPILGGAVPGGMALDRRDNQQFRPGRLCVGKIRLEVVRVARYAAFVVAVFDIEVVAGL